MPRTLYVISDLHLGGEPGFQMCPPAGQARLADFIDHVTRQHSAACPTHLLLAGDVVDFLAEQPFTSFTSDDASAMAKLRRIVDRTRPVWDALGRLARSGARLTLMLGNHDAELSLPGPRRLLDSLLTSDTAYLVDNQAFTDGTVLVEHGNRYDKWNLVSHDALRAMRSALSRREAPGPYLGPPGSRLVQSVMNPLKQTYPWVDLLKPENEAMLPVLAVLDPASLQHVPKLAVLAAEAGSLQFDDAGRPVDSQYIAGGGGRPDLAADPFWMLACELAGIDDPSNVGWIDAGQHLLARLKAAASDAARQAVLGGLHRALQAFAKASDRSFDSTQEEARYLIPAQVSAGNGFQVVVYGHTHLAKRCRLPGGALYLNTGTWADLMRLPRAVLGNEADGRRALAGLVADLRPDAPAGSLERWRGQLPTFARIAFDGDTLLQADVHRFDGGDASTPLPSGPLDFLLRD